MGDIKAVLPLCLSLTTKCLYLKESKELSTSVSAWVTTHFRMMLNVESYVAFSAYFDINLCWSSCFVFECML